jgi:hypothetical protein
MVLWIEVRLAGSRPSQLGSQTQEGKLRKSPFAKCRLCLNERQLQDSHLLPRAMYKIMRGDGPNPDPLVVTPGSTVVTSRQVKDYLLCLECEDRFSKNGERWVSANCFQADGSFPLRERLAASDVFFAGGTEGLTVYVGSAIPGVSTEQITYFAMSVFWRAAVQIWRMLAREAIATELGAYEDAVRRFLLDEASFPNEMALHVQVSARKGTQELAVFPEMVRLAEGYYEHHFVALGMGFWLFVGKRLPASHLTLCHAPDQKGIIVISEKLDAAIYSALVSMVNRHPDPRK